MKKYLWVEEKVHSNMKDETEMKGKFETEIKSNKQLKHQKDNKAA